MNSPRLVNEYGEGLVPFSLDVAKELTPGNMLYHASETDSRGFPKKARVNGKPKTWVREPDRVQIPMKYGLKLCFYVTEETIGNWLITESLLKTKGGLFDE